MVIKIENPKKRILAYIINQILKPIHYITKLFFPSYFSKNLPSEIKKFLVIRADHIGDVVMATSIFENIKKFYPHCKITVLCGKWAKPVLKDNPFIDEIFIHNCPWWEKIRGEKTTYFKWFLKELPEIIRKIRREYFDVGVDLRGDFRHILFFLFFGKVKFRISYIRSGGEYFLNKKVEYVMENHEIEKNFRLLEEIGIKNLSFEEKRPRIYLTEEDKERIEKFASSDKIKIVIHPSAGNPLRMWEKKNFVEIIEWLKETYDVEVFIVGKEKNIGREIEILSKGRVKNLMGKLSLGETSSLIEKCDLFIGNDSALAHIASCFDIPILILYGPTNPERCKPYSPYFHYIYHKFSCSPCLQIKCLRNKYSENGECMKEIKVEEVKDKIKEILIEVGPRQIKTGFTFEMKKNGV